MPRKASGEPKTKRVERRQANGSVYIYEVTTLYNPVKRYNEHVSSKLLGKKAADGSIISTRPRKSSADAVLTASRKTVGVTDILEWIGKASGIDDDLLSSTDKGTSQKVISIARFWMANPDKTIRRIEEWQISHTIPPWIKNMISELFPYAIHILDLYHVKERVCKFAKVHIKDEAQKSKWVSEVNGLIENGKIDEALSKIEPYRDSNNEDDTNLYNYISKRKEQMRYDFFRERGYPIGSGAQESANKYGMQDRMTLQGQRWKKERGQGVLALKCRYESNKWDAVEKLLFDYYETPVTKIVVTTL